MPDTIDIPEGASEADRRSIIHSVQRARRNANIRQEYPQLRDRHGRQHAFERLAESYDVQPSTVKAIVYEQR